MLSLFLLLSLRSPLVESRVASVPACLTSLEDYTVWAFMIDTEVQYQRLQALERLGMLRITAHVGDLGSIFSLGLLILIPKHIDTEKLADMLEAYAYQVYPANEDYYKTTPPSSAPSSPTPSPTPGSVDTNFALDTYHPLNSIHAHLRQLGERRRAVTEVVELPVRSYEGRPILGMRVSADVDSAEAHARPLVVLTAGIHGREWAAPATLLYMLDWLTGEEGAELRERYQFFLVPVVNVDGYAYTWRGDRDWRTTRVPSGCKYNLSACDGSCLLGECVGSDPNRNWDIRWGTTGVSTDPCQETHPGRAPFDQPCVRALRDYLVGHREHLSVFISYHSWGNYFLYPTGYSRDPTNHSAHHRAAGFAYSRAVFGVHWELYQSIQITDLMKEDGKGYLVSGSSIDWTYTELGLVDSYGVEVRGVSPVNGSNPFHLPTEQLIPTGENMAGLRALLAYLDK